MQEVARYLGIDTVSTPTFTADGGLLFLSDTTGRPQAYRLSKPGVRPERLTGHDQRISVLAPSPARPEFVYGMDRGSDEHDQLFLYDLETGIDRSLTDRPEVIHLWGGWDADGARFSFAANRRRTNAFDVYIQGRDDDPADATLVHEGDGGFLRVEGWAPEGDALVLTSERASFAHDLFRLDIETGTLERLSDHDEAKYLSPTFGSDGGLYVLSNANRESLALCRIDPATGERSVVVDGGEWDLDDFALHPDTGRLAYTRNVDGYSELVLGELVDPTTVEPLAVVEDDTNVCGELAIDHAGDRLAYTTTAPDRPHGVEVAGFDRDGETASDAAVPDAVPNAVRWVQPGTLGIPPETFERPTIVRYESFDGLEIPAYWTLPSNAADGETPVIVDIHGGPEHQRRPWFSPMTQYFLAQGYAVFEPNVRGSSGYGKTYAHLDDKERRLDSIADVAAAVEWLRDRPEVDPDRIVAYGRSYGGFMVLSAITEYPDLWAAAVDFVGIADFETFLENTGEWRRSHREAEYGSLENRDLLREISPIHSVDEISCPLFVQHGANDPRVPVGEARQIAAAVEGRGVPVETLIFDDEGHHTTDRTNRIEQFERISSFLARRV
ncbi:S9 family peptidase [Haloferacaceae archaeon DSL9]